MSDVFDDEVEAEPTISIGDYLKSVEEEELEADLILGGDEGNECTYGKGYVKRQAIFSCLTCTPDGNAGVCTACSLVCHDGHEILELWTKRNFRCDCGNSKFGEVYCKLLASKDVENTKNMYNHNFKGTYCTCDLPYPDPNVEEQVEMIQCCICEDWFHEKHIGLQSGDKIPRDEEGEPLYEDFICQGCSVICSFLTCYPQIISASDPSDTGKEKAIENTVLISSDTLDDDKQKRNENIQKLEGAELNFMNNLGHVEKMEILSGIADMKNEIFSFLESSDPSKPVTTVDIQQLFENLAKKRKLLDLGCRFLFRVRYEITRFGPTPSLDSAEGGILILCFCIDFVKFFSALCIELLNLNEDIFTNYEKKRTITCPKKLAKNLIFCHVIDSIGWIGSIRVVGVYVDHCSHLHGLGSRFNIPRPCPEFLNAFLRVHLRGIDPCFSILIHSIRVEGSLKGSIVCPTTEHSVFS
ncbi:hypothetical protein SASPL_148575 [Salvia splendens]|uniref:UBR-type domain-containing protein n=1 Tax=Salvia splendens TaxID=180675 RepID=A0A8X8WA31_SALSN|nr:hypothetical protein SASPL_148575 [Salvia splendens]